MDFIPVLPSAPLVLPLFVDTVAAGFPSPAQGYEQHGIDLNELLVRNAPATFLVRAKGDSMKAAQDALKRIYRSGYAYKKAGVVLPNLEAAKNVQQDMFQAEASPSRQQLMATLDQLNQRYGRGTVGLASSLQGNAWQMNRQRLSPCYTTRLGDVVSVN